MPSSERDPVRGSRTAALVACAALAASACGFHLQGRDRLPEYMAVVYLATDNEHTAFVHALKETLEASGVRVSAAPEDAGTTVRIMRDESEQRVLSVSARNTPEEYAVTYELEYAVESRGAEVLEPQRLELERSYAYDETAVLAKQREEEQLREVMARDLAGRVMRRLATL
jgi:LPS-assembly lipoprotein